MTEEAGIDISTLDSLTTTLLKRHSWVAKFSGRWYYNTPSQLLPKHPKRDSMLLEDFYNFLSIVFAVDEINRNPNLLPNVTLGYNVYDSYVDLFRTIQGAVRIYSGNTKQFPNYNCDKYGVLAAVVDGMASSFSIQYSNIFGMYKHPQISFISQDPLQGDKVQFPNFYRAVPSEKTLYAAIIALLNHFGWTWIGIICPDDDSSINAIKEIKKMFEGNGGCIEFIKVVPSINDYSSERIMDITNTINNATAKAILVYGSKNYVYYLEQGVHITNIPGKVWIHTAESSFRMLNIVNGTNVNGSLYLNMHKKEISYYIKFIHEVNPSRFPSGKTFTTWWDELCENRCPFNPRKRNCTGVESGRLHRFLKKVNFTNTMGQQIYFNNDEISCRYDIYNVVYLPNRTILSENVGSFYSDAPPGKQMAVNEKAIIWENSFSQTPRSVCSGKCPPGKRKSVWEGKPACCYDCLPCPEGEFSNETDVDVCTKCPENQWPNKQKTSCSLMDITFLSHSDPIGITLTVIAIVCFFTSAWVLGIFMKYQNTPIVKANNRDLSYLVLISLMCSFLCCLIFIGRPEQLTCFLQQAIFGITFTISVSSLLGKTFIVVVAFNATKPGNNLRKWVGAKIPKYIVITCSAIQVCICLLWLVISPPYSYYNKDSEPGIIIVKCNEGSVTAFYTILGYLCLLASVCFVAAFLARKLPDTFNDAKLITFSMLVFFSVWIFFILTSHSAKGTSTVAVEVFAILASSSGLLACMFVPKCYIILIKPEQNMKKNMVRGSAVK
ncbi:vomeronasal type-2 receptor 26 [Xenopus laevis]|uniref:Vomeronasal type-2 receptor 26 n=1 Tax=Xenopus laevis TaxID=8355 RepID=A0A8J1LJT3_XENLA|nr:vomeronasal type-2 receptor 26 [Xenopus laevis]